MGFSMEMIVVRPEEKRLHEHSEDIVTIWHPHALMTGYASWGEAERGNIPTGQQLAELCLTTWVYQRLSKYVGPMPTRRHFAPPFANPEELDEDAGFYRNPIGWVDVRLPSFKSGEQVILPLWRWGGSSGEEKGFPSLRDRQGHNQTLKLRGEKYTEWRKVVHLDPMNNPPYFWVEAGKAAYWMLELQGRGENISQTLLKKDDMAAAIVRAKRLYLEELGRAGCKVIFSFQARMGLAFELV